MTTALGCVMRLAALGACMALAACDAGQSKNWDDAPEFFAIGGTVSGLSGTLVLQNNGTDDLSVTANGSFAFKLSIASGTAYEVKVRTRPDGQPIGQTCTVTRGSGNANSNVTSVTVECRSNVTIGGTISGLTAGTVILQNNGVNPLATDTDGSFTFTALIANGATYAVTVATQPVGQTCSVTGGSGTASANVTNVAVVCSFFTLRPLPDVYTTGKAVNYSAFRAGGPNVGEVPSDADVLEDLQLLHDAGYNLLRLFGADSVSDKILRLATANFPEMKFQQGIFLEGPTPASCVEVVNDAQIAKAVQLANQYANVATVSVGNETSLAGNQRITCLAKYVQDVRSQVTQPVTADDDHNFYNGSNAAYRPDTILAQIDFASIHTYPFLNYLQTGWDWQQLGVTPPGPARAAAMMNAALDETKREYANVYDYEYVNAAGSTVSIGASLPIVIGEVGWKAVQTTPGKELERYAANPVNAKWYIDLLAGWERSAGGPVTIFPFEAFDETWKTTDDGWGLWDKDRFPRYALCGTPAGAPCNADLYQGAGFYPF